MLLLFIVIFIIVIIVVIVVVLSCSGIGRNANVLETKSAGIPRNSETWRQKPEKTYTVSLSANLSTRRRRDSYARAARGPRTL